MAFATVRELKKNRFAFIALLFFILDIGYFLLLKWNGIENNGAIYEAITSFILIVFFSFILQRIHSFYHSRSAINIVHLSIILIFSIISALFLQEYGDWIVKDANYRAFLEGAFFFRWLILFLIYLTAVNQFWIDKHIIEEANSLQRLIEKERQLVKSEMSNLQQQFQPHFLFNSLNSISALVKLEPDQSRQMIQNLSDYLRMTLQKSKEDFVTVEDELNYLNLYLNIEKVRFGHRLKIEMNVEEECLRLKIPTLILQPIVENAIKYGLYGNIGDLTIRIQMKINNGILEIQISNPYDPTTVTASKGTGFGLESINRKLQFIFRRNDLLKTEKKNEIFTTIMKIPQL